MANWTWGSCCWRHPSLIRLLAFLLLAGFGREATTSGLSFSSRDRSAEPRRLLAAGTASGDGQEFVYLELRNQLVDFHGHTFGSKGYQEARIEQTRRRLLGFAKAAAPGTRKNGSLANLQMGGSQLTGTYYVQIGLGTPQQLLQVTFDTGSSILWTNCDCTSCPLSSDLITLTYYKPEDSSTSQQVPCGANCDELQLQNYGAFACSNGGQCSFRVVYGDKSTVQGPVVQDTVSLPATGNGTSYITGQVILGCGREQSGQLTNPRGALDGLLGMGEGADSMLGQLAQQRVLPYVFSFCLDSMGVASHAILGRGPSPANALRVPLVTNPMQRLQVPYYYIPLQQITVAGNPVLGSEIMAEISAETGNGGVIVDSGTTITNLPAAVYNNLEAAIQQASPQPFDQRSSQGFLCAQLSTNDLSGFPDIVMQFSAGKWVVKPSTYLLLLDSLPMGPYLYCLGAMAGSAGRPSAIVGESWIANSFIQIDTVAGTLSTAPLDCKSGNYFGAAAVEVPGPPGWSGGRQRNMHLSIMIVLMCLVHILIP